VLLVLAVIAAAGCSLGGDEPPSSNPEPFVYPAWLNATFTDRRITIRYPGRLDARTLRPLRRLRRRRHRADGSLRRGAIPPQARVREPRRVRQLAELAARILRPPSGRGTTLEYTQAARIGDRAGIEASIIWAADEDSPIGPTMRVYGIELDSGEVAILIFAVENQTNHAAEFGWIKRPITWDES
jgi:hypothetical protein